MEASNGRSWKRMWRFESVSKIEPRFCSFEWIYFQHHISSRVYGYRYEIGEALAEEETQVFPPDALVTCMPRTAIPMAAGFADELGLTFDENAIQKAPSIERTFILSSDEARREACKAKFIYSADDLKGRWVFLIDGSLVRGNTIRTTLEALKALGVAQVDVRIASPPPLPVANPCDKEIDIPTKKELAWNRLPDETELAGLLGCDSLRYLTVDHMKTVMGSKVCTYCFTREQAWADAF